MMAIRTHSPLWIRKSGEGSRGGVVIGHTKSGKAVYRSIPQQHEHGPMKDWTYEDHHDAAEAHRTEKDRRASSNDDEGQTWANAHEGFAKRHIEMAEKIAGFAERAGLVVKQSAAPKKRKSRPSLKERQATEAARNVNTSESTRKLFGLKRTKDD